MCQENSPALGLCEASLTFICGQNKDQLELDDRILPDFLKHLSHAVSLKQINHYLQLYTSGNKFRQYDYRERNKKVYNSSTPPNYKLDNVKAPIYLYSGKFDAIVSERDVEHLKEVLPNVRKYRSIRNYNHCDFNYGKNSRKVLFGDILNSMNSARIG